MYDHTSIAQHTPGSHTAAVNEVAHVQDLTEAGGELNDRLPIQLKLSVGATDDPLEHEADAMADKVMRMPDASFVQRKVSGCCNNCDDEHVRLKPLVNQITPFIQAKGDGGGIVSDSVSNKIKSSLGGGNTMDTGTRSFMENRFGTDFSDVKIHNNAESEQLNRSLDAKAFTVSNNIYFNGGQYAPATDSGKHLLAHELTHVVQQSSSGSGSVLHRSPKKTPPPPVAGGNILYIGMNNYQPEVNKLSNIYRGTSVNVTTVTVTENEDKTDVGGVIYDLTSATGIHNFAASLSADAKKISSVETVLNSQSSENRDDLAHVIAVYAACENDGKDRMSRVVLSGHSYGTKVYNHDAKGAILFQALVDLAAVFPRAAGQTKHLIVLACMAADEQTIKDYYLKAFPGIITVSGWTSTCPTGQGAADTLGKWAKTTDSNPTKLDMPPTGQANWAAGNYQNDAPVDPVALLAGLRTDESKFNEYFDGTKVDSSAYSGFLIDYYHRARSAELQTATITGADHQYAKLHADQSYRLRFWTAMTAHFWGKNALVITASYGKTPVPAYGTMSRKNTLATIGRFDTDAAGSAADIATAKPLLDGVKNLDPVILDDNWI